MLETVHLCILHLNDIISKYFIYFYVCIVSTVASELLKEGAVLHIYDPLAKFESMKKEMQRQEIYYDFYDAKIKFFEDGESASINSHAIVILTEWEDFRQCKYERMFKKMKRPSFIFDGRNLLNREDIEQIGYAYIKLG
ncbi:hypothetical protein ABPG72_006061 [Tetrahymena utriculariae]